MGNETFQHQVPLWCDGRRGPRHHFCGGTSNTSYLNLIMREQQTNTNWGAFYKITDQYSSKVSRAQKTKKEWETVPDWDSSYYPESMWISWCWWLYFGYINVNIWGSWVKVNHKYIVLFFATLKSVEVISRDFIHSLTSFLIIHAFTHSIQTTLICLPSLEHVRWGLFPLAGPLFPECSPHLSTPPLPWLTSSSFSSPCLNIFFSMGLLWPPSLKKCQTSLSVILNLLQIWGHFLSTLNTHKIFTYVIFIVYHLSLPASI